MKPDIEPPRVAVFRADASPDIGAGHVVRCSALAEALGDIGWETVLACRADTLCTAGSAAARFARTITLDGPEADEPARLATALPGGCGLLVVDHYGRDARFEAACRPWARQILVLDDLADRPHDCDVLLDQTPGRTEGDYDGRVPKRARLLIGPQWALLRPAFGMARLAGLAQRREVRRALVTPGATDRVNLASRIVAALSSVGLPIAVDVMLAGSAPFLDVVRAQAAAAPVKVAVHVDVANPIPLMQAADLAIGAAGSTALERCCLGLPSLMIITADNQRNVAAGVAAAGAGELLGDAASIDAADIARAVDALAADAPRRQAMAATAAKLCDGLGARRVATLFDRPLCADDGAAVTLRLATPADGDIMYDWQQHPETRRFARSPAKPDASEHRAWLERRLADPGCVLNLIMHDGAPAGVVRLDRRDEAAMEVSLLVSPERYGQGVGRAALGLVRRLLPQVSLLANVLPGNKASQRLFAAAGYRPAGDGWWRQDGPPPAARIAHATARDAEAG